MKALLDASVNVDYPVRLARQVRPENQQSVVKSVQLVRQENQERTEYQENAAQSVRRDYKDSLVHRVRPVSMAVRASEDCRDSRASRAIRERLVCQENWDHKDSLD